MGETDEGNPGLTAALEFLSSIDPSGPELVQTMMAANPEISRDLVRGLYGELYQRCGISLRERLMVTIGVLAAAGLVPQLNYQFRFALLAGVSYDDLNEVLRQVAFFTGQANAINAGILLGRIRGELESEKRDRQHDNCVIKSGESGGI